LGCDLSFDDFRQLAETHPDAVLIEVPHGAQDEISVWTLETGCDLLIGGCLASTLKAGVQIQQLAARRGLVVEAGYQRRYDPAWEEIRRLIGEEALGEPIMAASMAIFHADPRSWYYDQEASGGMPLTHLSYCYLNAIRWILGRPTVVSAMASKKVETGPEMVLEETCAALVGFENGSFVSATAGYAGPEGMADAEPRFICARGGIQAHAADASGAASITVFREGGSEVRSFSGERGSPFVRQAHSFLDATETRGEGRNPPGDALADIRVAEAISLSARERRTVTLDRG
jgi:predicted dehydrogenase